RPGNWVGPLAAPRLCAAVVRRRAARQRAGPRHERPHLSPVPFGWGGYRGGKGVASGRARGGASGGTVLLVEDEADVRATAAEHLRSLSYTVFEAGDGVSA